MSWPNPPPLQHNMQTANQPPLQVSIPAQPTQPHMQTPMQQTNMEPLMQTSMQPLMQASLQPLMHATVEPSMQTTSAQARMQTAAAAAKQTIIHATLQPLTHGSLQQPMQMMHQPSTSHVSLQGSIPPLMQASSSQAVLQQSLQLPLPPLQQQQPKLQASGQSHSPLQTIIQSPIQTMTQSPIQSMHSSLQNPMPSTSQNIPPLLQTTLPPPMQPIMQPSNQHAAQPMQSSAQAAAQPFEASGSPPTEEEGPVSLMTEISDIMRSFGDTEVPRTDTVQLVEQILRQQLRGIFNEAAMEAQRRKENPCPTQADFEFLMRNHPVKIARMRRHLKDMRILKKFLSLRSGRPQDYMDETDPQTSDDESTAEVPEMFDEERTRRLFRADRMSQILSGQQYMEFNEARKTSFYCRHGEKIKNKFRRFLDLPSDMRIPNSTMNILAYFAHETIAAVVDFAILTRLNSDNRVQEPYSRVPSTGASPSLMHLCPEVTQGRGMEATRPITTQEVHEAMRRFRQSTNRRIGFYRNTCDRDGRRSYLAL